MEQQASTYGLCINISHVVTTFLRFQLVFSFAERTVAVQSSEMEFKDDLTGVGLVSTLSFLFKFLSGLGCLIRNSGVAELCRLVCLRRVSRRRTCHCRNVTFYLLCYILGDRHGYRSATWITLYTRRHAFNGKLLVSDATLTIGPAVHSCTMPSRLGATAL
jgi:hypothetical protein